MIELKHTCANNDGLRDVGQVPQDCLACDVDLIRDGLGTVSPADARAGHAALRRIYAALATRSPLPSESGEREHLERGCAVALVYLEAYGPSHTQEDWLNAERARKDKRGC